MKKVIMLILDGFGINDSEYGNAVKQSTMDCYNDIFNEYPHAILQAKSFKKPIEDFVDVSLPSVIA